MKTKNLIITAACIAIGIVLPQVFHAVPNAGSVLLPMHIPVLLCGLTCTWPYGLACGILTPVLSSVITGMPPAAYLPAMVVELAIYGLLSAVFMFLLKKQTFTLRVYTALVLSMVCGRIAYGIVNALIFRAGSYSMQLWLTASFVTALPGIIIQLVVIPVILLALQRAKVIAPART